MTLREWLEEGPFTLALCSGFFGFYAHCGFVTALEEAGLRPSAMAGSSAGALVAGLWASGRDGAEIGEQLLSLRRQDFWDPAPWAGAGLLRGRLFRERLDLNLGVASIEECRVPLAVSLWGVRERATVVRTSGPLAAILHASCCVPGLFQPVELEGKRYLDGGIADRPALDAVAAVAAPGERVLHHHLTSRSPWRKKGSVGLRLPEREGLVPVVVDGLPRCGPFKMDRGPAAMARAAEGLREALDLPPLAS
jgi:NTE family protein